MYKRHILGKLGEKIAERYLQENNYKIIEKNFECRQGEIDIIARQKDQIVFVEVKTRTNRKYGNPIEAVTNLKLKHIMRTIKYYLYIKKLENQFITIDVIEIYEKNKKFFVHHIKDIIN